MQKIGFSLQDNYSLPLPEIFPLLRDAGFHAASPQWQRDMHPEEIARAADGCGLILQSLHAPFRGLPGMWSREEAQFAPILADLLQSVKDCAACGIPVLVVHSWGGIRYTFREEELVFDHFDKVVDCARKEGVQIAFENLEGPEFLDALLSRYRELPHVGLCWDSGHELCYTPSRDFLRDYGDRLLMTHLNDNYGITRPDGQLLGTDDLHLFPYDGIADWTTTIDRLQAAKRQQILSFELKIRPKGDRCTTDLYSAMPLESYFAEAYRRASRASATYWE